MNVLMDKPGHFIVGRGRRAVQSTTVGADLSAFRPYSEFAGSSSSAGGHVGFVDVEGQGEEADKFGEMLVTPLMLVSKTVILMWNGKDMDNMLLKLVMAVAAGRKIMSVDDGRIYGHLHIIVLEESCIDGNLLFKDEKCPPSDPYAMKRNNRRAVIPPVLRQHPGVGISSSRRLSL